MYCKNCEYWARNKFEQKYAIDEYWVNHYKAKTKFGNCSCDNMINGDGEMLDNYYLDRTGNELIFDDAEGCASLQTGENFGCIHFKENSTIPKELYKFDITEMWRKEAVKEYIEEGLTQKQAEEKFELDLKNHNAEVKRMKLNMENIKCDFTGKVFGSIKTIDDKISTPSVEKILRGKWIKASKDEGLKALKEGKYILVLYEDGTQNLLTMDIEYILNTVYGANSKQVTKSVVKLPERYDSLHGTIEIKNVFIWEYR